jgi:hypothetical protein
VHNERLYVIKPGPGAHAKKVFTDDRVPVAPSFAPLLKSRVIVFGTQVPEGGDAQPEVCWMDLDAKFPSPSCKGVNATSIDGFAWSPHGDALLVSATDVDQFGLLRLSTRSPFASEKAQWAGGGAFDTPVKQAGRGVRAASFSPDGKRLALVSNLRSKKKFVVSTLVTSDLKKFKKPKSSSVLTTGCDVDWRPDNLELLVVQPKKCTPGARGLIVRVAFADPRPVLIGVKPHRLRGAHPAYQPIDLSPGPAQAPVRGTRP